MPARDRSDRRCCGLMPRGGRVPQIERYGKGYAHRRRYLSEESLALVLEDQGDEGKEVHELQAT